jgi:hypothetical protein
MMRSRSNIAFGLLLILLGGWFLAIEFVPALKAFADKVVTWPMLIIAIGVVLAFFALVLWVPSLWIPACIVGGIGGLLYWQNLTGNWASWSYTWTLIPGFVGVGMLISGFLRGSRHQITGAGWNILTSLVLFAIFGSFLGGIGILSIYWPILLILVGVVIIGQGLFRHK